MRNVIYLDFAAATPLDDDVLEAMRPYFAGNFYNPSATYKAAKDVKQSLESARTLVAGILGVKATEVIFTAGGTEANNLAIAGILSAFPGTHTVTTALEHDSVRGPISAHLSKGWTRAEVLPGPDGIVQAGQVTDAVTENTVLVSIMYANNELGAVQPLKQIATELRQIRKTRLKTGNTLPLYFHTDAAQAGNYLDLHAHRLGVDLMTLNGGKIYGPKQSGVLFVASHVKLVPLLHGGGQERGLRSGTENVAGCIGFAKALEIAQKMRPAETTRLQALQKQFVRLIRNQLPSARINGSMKHRLPNNVHITIPGEDNERLLFGLDERGIQCAAGSACSASKEESSHVLKTLGLTDADARASLRFSMGRQTTTADIRKVVRTLSELVLVA